MVQVFLFPLTYFDLRIADWDGGGGEIIPTILFLDKEMLLIDLKLDIHTKLLKNFQKNKKYFSGWRDVSY